MPPQLKPNGIVTLITDFQTKDAYVGAMKGALLSVASDLNIVDVTHDVPPQNVRYASRILSETLPYFPAGTVHCCVVDPGVGSHREALIFQIRDQWVIAPDNGLISGIYEGASDLIWRIAVEDFENACHTFHGRDIFAPTAAALASGQKQNNDFNSYSRKPLLLKPIEAVMDADGSWIGEIIAVDAFGNLITNLPGVLLEKATQLEIEGVREPITAVVQSYHEAEKGVLVALCGSSNNVEISLKNANTSHYLEIGCGIAIRLI